MSIPNTFDPLGSRGFTRVEYLQSTGVQWIDTGIKPSEFDEFEIQFFYKTGYQYNGDFFGVDDDSRGNYSSNAITCYTTQLSDLYYAYGGESYLGSSYGQKVTYAITGNKCKISNEVKSSSREKDKVVIDVTMRLFRSNGAGASKSYLNCGLQIFYAWFKKDGNLLAHFVPTVDPKGVACMLELVSGVPFYNQGTGEFIIGPRI